MEAKELRIGNFIMDRGNKVWQIDYWEYPTKVASKSPFLGYLDTNNKKAIYGHPFTEEVDYLQPIPLTEEWLLRLPKDFYYKILTWIKHIHTRKPLH